jgi:hypothetical protein
VLGKQGSANLFCSSPAFGVQILAVSSAIKEGWPSHALRCAQSSRVGNSTKGEASLAPEHQNAPPPPKPPAGGRGFDVEVAADAKPEDTITVLITLPEGKRYFYSFPVRPFPSTSGKGTD